MAVSTWFHFLGLNRTLFSPKSDLNPVNLQQGLRPALKTQMNLTHLTAPEFERILIIYLSCIYHIFYVLNE